VELVEELVVNKGADEADFAAQHPILAVCWAFALLIQDISSLEVEICHMAASQPEEPFRFINLRPETSILGDNVI